MGPGKEREREREVDWLYLLYLLCWMATVDQAGCLKADQSNNQMILKSMSSGRALVRVKKHRGVKPVHLNRGGGVPLPLPDESQL
jgi:hypothetical protein